MNGSTSLAPADVPLPEKSKRLRKALLLVRAGNTTEARNELEAEGLYPIALFRA